MKKKTPQFRNEAEGRDFWQSHDSTEYVDWTKAERLTPANLKPSVKTISLRLPESMLEELKLLANKRARHIPLRLRYDRNDINDYGRHYNRKWRQRQAVWDSADNRYPRSSDQMSILRSYIRKSRAHMKCGRLTYADICHGSWDAAFWRTFGPFCRTIKANQLPRRRQKTSINNWDYMIYKRLIRFACLR